MGVEGEEKKTSFEISAKLLEDSDAVELDEGYQYDEEDETILEAIFYVLPNLKKRWKSILLAIVLFLLGIGLFSGAMIFFIQGQWTRACPMLFISIICGLPGGYVCFVIYKVIVQDPNYDIEEIPE